MAFWLTDIPLDRRGKAITFVSRSFRGNLRLLLRLISLCVSIGIAGAQTSAGSNPPRVISIEDAVRIALAYNQSLRAQRLNIDQNRAEEITAALKPNPTFSTLVDTIPLFSPQTIRFNTQIYSEALSYTYERGGKREKRLGGRQRQYRRVS